MEAGNGPSRGGGFDVRSRSSIKSPGTAPPGYRPVRSPSYWVPGSLLDVSLLGVGVFSLVVAALVARKVRSVWLSRRGRDVSQ